MQPDQASTVLQFLLPAIEREHQTTANVLAKGGNLFAHADFAGIALNVNDSITFTWKDQLT